NRKPRTDGRLLLYTDERQAHGVAALDVLELDPLRPGRRVSGISREDRALGPGHSQGLEPPGGKAETALDLLPSGPTQERVLPVHPGYRRLLHPLPYAGEEPAQFVGSDQDRPDPVPPQRSVLIACDHVSELARQRCVHGTRRLLHRERPRHPEGSSRDAGLIKETGGASRLGSG